ncbi:4Fe-4S dicluster domain-containing protein [Candidatus Fermentibacterales bacterium]|nr:4Fe-4S dicluster domain-containing protein [Candidatus Fermentibacterales bacterium]
MTVRKKVEEKEAPPVEEGLVPIFVMGERYMVPESLTIQKALEYAGYQLIRGCGCRGGVCGACSTVFRMPDSYRVEVGLACQTVVRPGMYLAMLPFFPANRAISDIESMKGTGGEVASLYPEIFKCIGCNLCTQSCPMDIDVMHYMAQAIRGDVSGVAETSFDCIACGLCVARCPAEEVQYHVGMLCRRLHARHLVPESAHLAEQVDNVAGGRFEKTLQELMKTGDKDLRKLYKERVMEPDIAADDWAPEDSSKL